jgi:hypothetical protein
MKPYLSKGSRLFFCFGAAEGRAGFSLAKWLSEKEVKVYQFPEGGAIAKAEHDDEVGMVAEYYDAVGLGLQQTGIL